MAPACTLDDTGLRQQLERYRSVGRGSDERRLSFAVPSVEHEPTLDGISRALGLDTPTGS
jgi:hypothetical protein